MGLSGSEVRCKKHPKHRQSPGVCSVCLRERLSQLSSAKTSSSTSAAVISYMSSSSSSSSSSYSSPITYDHHLFMSSSTKGRLGPVSFLVSGKDGLQRSRSMAFVGARKRLDEEPEINRKKKKSGFWSRVLLLGSTSKRKQAEPLVHSQTMKETRAARLV